MMFLYPHEQLNWDNKQSNHAEQFRSMLDQHMLAMRGVAGPQGMTGLPGRVVSSSKSHLI